MSIKINWSNSKVSWLRQCNRKFYFAYQLASHGYKDRLKRKAFELKQMQNIQMWQGSVVDKIIENQIIPDIKEKAKLDFDYYAELAIDLAQKRFKFSEDRKYLNNNISKASIGDEFCILDIHEIGECWPENKISNAYANIRNSIVNIPDTLMPNSNTTLISFLKSTNLLIPNINNWFVHIENAIIKPQIDLILYDNKWKPAVIDWKVSDSWVSDYSRQLEIIGLLIYLKRLEKPDKNPYKHKDINLFEVNLLKKKVKQHEFSEEISADLIDYINLTSSDIQLILSDIKDHNLVIHDFDTTDNQSTCNFCNFKVLLRHKAMNLILC